ncbi:hypothetical protein DICPUDRAFT_78378 [Dictyostelium purpureum]|uniref:Uncharacterized protein n=1 Tax=Dictyostelium purpureum TaxID=5786 RepID=F0ZJD3_DICPU|nr:uncharacterized protein DICPUDRAFT_78378 [Dictyostelium purpureum]EGC35941.1 hypothetical protein DICPUDRAFT_78378 [Dictyostelium purpureum]|eukprot:XP_003287514.1 hypothetical protein DICPUDRAFT_78378 [Dictyostelium purpureum]
MTLYYIGKGSQITGYGLHDIGDYFELPSLKPNPFGSSLYNFGAWSFSLEPMNTHNQSGSCLTSSLHNLQLEVTTKPLTEDYYLDFYSISPQFIQQWSNDIQRVYNI